SRSLVVRYFSDVAQDSGSGNGVYAVARQYTDTTGFAADEQGFVRSKQTLVDRQAFPMSGDCGTIPVGATMCLTDAEIEAELTRLIEADGLPTGSLNIAPIYFVVLPTSVNVCISAGDCANHDFCGYHSYLSANDGSNVLYAVVPTISISAHENPKDCQWDGNAVLQEPNHDPMDVLLSTFSHEDIETITDPLLNAWYAGNWIEAGDMCAHTGGDDPLGTYDPNAFLPVLGGSTSSGDLYDQLINGDRYYLQSEWSNGAGGCAMSPGDSSLVSQFKATFNGTSVF